MSAKPYDGPPMNQPVPRGLRTLIAINEEESGACVAFPVMRPEWAAYGSRDDVLAELRLFLVDEEGRTASETWLARWTPR